jgi:AcrR family transcriptional regulator
MRDDHVAASASDATADHDSGRREVVRKDVIRNRARILSAADDLVAKRGLDITLNELAHHAGVGVGTVYRHFPDRAAVVNAMLTQRIEQAEQIIRAGLDLDDPVEAFRSTLTGVCQRQAHDRGVFQALTSAGPAEQRQQVRRRLEPLMSTLVERVHAAGWLREDITVTDMPIVFWLVGNLARQTAQTHPDLWRRYLNLILEGMSTNNPSDLGASPLPPDAVVDALAATTS